MTTEQTKEPVENEAVDETQQDTPSDRRVILGPLVLYGLVAFVVSGLIVTTAILIDKEYNQIDKQVTTLHTEIEDQHHAEQVVEPKPAKLNEDIKGPAVETMAAVDNNIEKATEVKILEVDQSITVATDTAEPEAIALEAAPVVTAPETSTTTKPAQVEDYKTFDPEKRRVARITEHNEFMARKDQEMLSSFKASQAKQIEMLRQHLARQQQRIEALEKRNLETYQMREAAMKRMQKDREQFLNRI